MHKSANHKEEDAVNYLANCPEAHQVREDELAGPAA